jgi:hypothetical protein
LATRFDRSPHPRIYKTRAHCWTSALLLLLLLLLPPPHPANEQNLHVLVSIVDFGASAMHSVMSNDERRVLQMPSDVALSGLKSHDDLMKALNQLGYGNINDVVADLNRLLDELRLDKRKPPPPDDYLCHVCFQKGHFIKDCPQVCWLHLDIGFSSRRP